METISVQEVFDAVCQKIEEMQVPKFGQSCRVIPPGKYSAIQY